MVWKRVKKKDVDYSCIGKKNIYFNPFLNKLWFLSVCSTSLLKTLWEKETLQAISHFPSVFYPLENFLPFLSNLNVYKVFLFGRVQNLSFGKGILTSHTSSSKKRGILF